MQRHHSPRRRRSWATVLALAVGFTGSFAGTGTASASGDESGRCPPTAVSDHDGDAHDGDAHDEAGSDEPASATVPDPDELESRCDIDPEAYLLAWDGRTLDQHATTAPTGRQQTVEHEPAAVEGQDAAVVVDEEAVDEPTPAPAPPPLLPPEEPGFLDDNTFVDAGESRWIVTDDDRESTFALDVDTASLTIAETFLARGYLPDPDSIRPEEWINSFDYGDTPATDDNMAITIDTGALRTGGDDPDPILARIGITTAELADEDRPAVNLTIVVDTSGSMNIRERLGLVQASLALLVRNLREDDTIAIVTYHSGAEPLLAPTPVAEWRDILEVIDALEPGGSTNLEAGLRLGYDEAGENFDPERLNVVLLASDGVANQGVTDVDELTAHITQAGEEGIHFVTVGYGMGNYNDHLMEQLANRGDGFYAYISTYAEAVRLFVTELTPTLTVAARQAKVQVMFDDEVVERYRLIGYENRRLDDSQFRDDSVDAGELGYGHHVSALYELELVDGLDGDGDDDLVAGEVRLRWEDPDSGHVTELAMPLDLTGGDAPSESLRLATLVAHTAEVLQGGSAVAERGITLDELLAEAEALVADGVTDAIRIIDLITVALHAEDPLTE